jgi:hypothetical protein
VQSTVNGWSLLVIVTILKDEIEKKTNEEKEKKLNQLG